MQTSFWLCVSVVFFRAKVFYRINIVCIVTYTNINLTNENVYEILDLNSEYIPTIHTEHTIILVYYICMASKGNNAQAH